MALLWGGGARSWAVSPHDGSFYRKEKHERSSDQADGLVEATGVRIVPVGGIRLWMHETPLIMEPPPLCVCLTEDLRKMLFLILIVFMSPQKLQITFRIIIGCLDLVESRTKRSNLSSLLFNKNILILRYFYISQLINTVYENNIILKML